MQLGAVVVWAARVVWLLTAVFGGAAFGDALSARSRAVQLTATTLLWVGWAAVALALAIPSTVSLTVIRATVPAAVVVAVAAAFDADAVDAAVSIGLAVLMLAITWSGELGERFAQSSAYGDEQRFPLRPPVAYLLPAALSWAILCSATIVGPLALAAGAWWLGVPVTLVAAGLVWFLGRRFHRLSRRWLVLVPAGLVVHDHVVLAETVMVRAANVAGASLALADTEAADLTGPAAGHVVEIRVTAPETVVLAPTRQTRAATALHVRAVLVAPTRPGRVLAAAARRGLPVA